MPKAGDFLGSSPSKMPSHTSHRTNQLIDRMAEGGVLVQWELSQSPGGISAVGEVS